MWEIPGERSDFVGDCEDDILLGAFAIGDEDIAESVGLETTNFELVAQPDGSATGSWNGIGITVEGIIGT